MPMLSLALCSGHANVVIGLVQRSGNQCHDRPCGMIGQVPVQLETISPMVANKNKKNKSIYIYLSRQSLKTPVQNLIFGRRRREK